MATTAYIVSTKQNGENNTFDNFFEATEALYQHLSDFAMNSREGDSFQGHVLDQKTDRPVVNIDWTNDGTWNASEDLSKEEAVA